MSKTVQIAYDTEDTFVTLDEEVRESEYNLNEMGDAMKNLKNATSSLLNFMRSLDETHAESGVYDIEGKQEEFAELRTNVDVYLGELNRVSCSEYDAKWIEMEILSVANRMSRGVEVADEWRESRWNDDFSVMEGVINYIDAYCDAINSSLEAVGGIETLKVANNDNVIVVCASEKNMAPITEALDKIASLEFISDERCIAVDYQYCEKLFSNLESIKSEYEQVKEAQEESDRTN